MSFPRDGLGLPQRYAFIAGSPFSKMKVVIGPMGTLQLRCSEVQHMPTVLAATNKCLARSNKSRRGQSDFSLTTPDLSQIAFGGARIYNGRS
jgi:hypothetical protein